MKTYTGIGSRSAPLDVLELCTYIATMLDRDGWYLRSGGAPGCDQAFEAGSNNAAIYLPWPKFRTGVFTTMSVWYVPSPSNEARMLAGERISGYHHMKRGTQALLARNMHQVLGFSLNHPTDFVICWTPDAEIVGGTAHAIRLAKDKGIPVYNLASESDFLDLCAKFEWNPKFTHPSVEKLYGIEQSVK